MGPADEHIHGQRPVMSVNSWGYTNQAGHGGSKALWHVRLVRVRVGEDVVIRHAFADGEAGVKVSCTQ